ncbi:MAG: rhodanese-like domain-containing protein [Polyangiaceae bacterium]
MRFLLGEPNGEGPTATELLQKGAILLDVRTREEFQQEHVQGAMNIPLSELPRRVDELGDKGHPVVLYCLSGARSASAKELLLRAGFRHVHDLGAMLNLRDLPRQSSR